MNVSHDRSDQCANFPFKRSKIKLTGRQKLPENVAYLTQTWLVWWQSKSGLSVGIQNKPLLECALLGGRPHNMSALGRRTFLVTST